MHRKRDHVQEMDGPHLADIAASALNEQGYLFQLRVAHEIRRWADTSASDEKWKLSAVEIPVSTTTKLDTRVDLVLEPHDGQPPRRVIIETKRANADFKLWFFFGDDVRGIPAEHQRIFFESLAPQRTGAHANPKPAHHYVSIVVAREISAIFDFGVEAKIDERGTASGQRRKVSSTEAIETALRQVLRGVNGYAWRFSYSTPGGGLLLIPVIVTTATLASVSFDQANVSIDQGKVDPTSLNVQQRDWVAVNYPQDDSLSSSMYNERNESRAAPSEYVYRDLRTVFVVQAGSLGTFLDWLAPASRAWK